MRGALEPLLEGHIEAQPPALHERRDLPEADVAEIGPLITREPVECVDRPGTQTRVLFDPPDPRVGIEERRRRHRTASMSASSTAGAKGSPAHRAVPRPPSQGRSPSPLAGT